MKDAADERFTARDKREYDGRELAPQPNEDEPHGPEYYAVVREIDASMRTIQILGQVLRNGVGSISGDEKTEIVDVIFKLARRILGFIFDKLDESIGEWKEKVLEKIVEREFEEAAQRILERSQQDGISTTPGGTEGRTNADIIVDEMSLDAQGLADEVNRHVFSLCVMATFRMVKHVSDAVGLRLLENTFGRVVKADPVVPNKMFDLSIDLDNGVKLPKDKAVNLHKELAKNKNYFAETIVKWLVTNHLYLYEVSEKISRCSVCKS